MRRHQTDWKCIFEWQFFCLLFAADRLVNHHSINNTNLYKAIWLTCVIRQVNSNTLVDLVIIGVHKCHIAPHKRSSFFFKMIFCKVGQYGQRGGVTYPSKVDNYNYHLKLHRKTRNHNYFTVKKSNVIYDSVTGKVVSNLV